MTHITILGLHAWAYDEHGHQTYADPDAGDVVAGWNVHTQHRDPNGDELIDPAGAFDFDVDFDTYDEARAAAEALQAEGKAVEIREY